MTIRTNDSFSPTSPASSLALSSASAFDIGLVLDAVIAPAPSTVADRIALVVINSYMTFYYGKTVTAEDLTSSKLYIRGII